MSEDQIMARSAGMPDDLPERLWAVEDLGILNGGPTIDVTHSLISLRYIMAALKRRARFWGVITLIGFVIGCGLYVELPPAHHATVTVLLIDDPAQDPAIEVQTDVALAQSTAVAQGVVKQLGLQQSPASLGAAYTVVAVTDQVLQINVGAPTSGDAVTRVAAIAKQFLQYRAQYAQIQLQQTENQLNQQLSQAQQNLDAVNSQLSQATSQGVGHAKLTALKARQKAATDALAQVQQYVTGELTVRQQAVAAMVRGSQVINSPTALKLSRLKSGPLYIVGGLFGGLVLGMAIVALGAITSDKLRRRDDISYTFGAPVRLSVGPLRPGRMPGLPGKAVARERDMKRVAEYLSTTIPGSSRGPAGLAIVATDDARTVAEVVVALALDNASRGARIMLADLSEGGHAARRLGVDKPGIHPVNSGGTNLLVVVPDPEDVAPVGPLRGRTQPGGHAEPDERLTTASTSADLLLALVSLDPAVGGEHLATWATDVVAMVTAGESSAAKIQATGEMIRLSGARLESVVLIGVDKGDESLGMWGASRQHARA